MSTPNTTLSLQQAAADLQVAPKTLRRWIDAGLLPAERLGPHLIRIQVADLRNLSRPIAPAVHDVQK